ncbi:MAG: ABC transporter ATP-binding protein [Simkaniaceae bacterium]
MNDKKVILSINQLHVKFKGKQSTDHILRGISFSIKEGERIAIVGESGCGKSFTAKSILGILPKKAKKEGEIIYKGKNILQIPEREMRRIRGREIGIIFQDPMTSLNPTMKIGKQILEAYIIHNPGTNYSQAKAKTIDLLNLVGIPEPHLRYHQYPHELSGGMRQRIMIAIALAPSPSLLIADEPTTALDVTIQAQILDLLKEIQNRSKKSILLITHDLSLVAGFCEKVLVMYAGQIIEFATVENIFSRPKHPYTKLLLNSLPNLDKVLDKLHFIEGSPPGLNQIFEGCSFFNRCPSRLKRCQNQLPKWHVLSPCHKVLCSLFDKTPSEEASDENTPD